MFGPPSASILAGYVTNLQSISFQAMSQKLTQMMAIVQRDPAVANVVGFTGAGGGGAASQTNTGSGAVLALLLFGTDFSLIAVIGVIVLIGIVKKNAILMIDFALHAERVDGASSREAIFQACLTRLRPITMTTAAALLGALPLALAFGNGAELRRPLGISIVGGSIVSQVLTLYTTPSIYLLLDRLRLRRRAAPLPSPAE